MNVQLIDAFTGFQVWADDFIGDLKDVFALQEQTALKIGEALNLKLSADEERAIEHRYTQDPDAYEAYLKGRAVAEHFGRPTERTRSGTSTFRACTPVGSELCSGFSRFVPRGRLLLSGPRPS